MAVLVGFPGRERQKRNPAHIKALDQTLFVEKPYDPRPFVAFERRPTTMRVGLRIVVPRKNKRIFQHIDKKRFEKLWAMGEGNNGKIENKAYF